MKTIALAPRGGGAHGAFHWGVLDRLSRQRELRISAISATSSGAFKAAAYFYDLPCREILFHRISGDDYMRGLGYVSKANPSLPLLKELRDHGWAAAEAWLRTGLDRVGRVVLRTAVRQRS
jgi:predicted acylesterase/phospholipase RssA